MERTRVLEEPCEPIHRRISFGYAQNQAALEGAEPLSRAELPRRRAVAGLLDM
jgi:hypothetical protein